VGTEQDKATRGGRRSHPGSNTHPGGVGLVELVEHDDGGAAVVVHQPPEVGGGVLQRVQGDDEGSALGVALRRGKTSTIKDMAVALKPLLSHPRKPVQPEDKCHQSHLLLSATKAIFSMLEQSWHPWHGLSPSMPWCWGDAIKPGLGDPCP